MDYIWGEIIISQNMFIKGFLPPPDRLCDFFCVYAVYIFIQ